MHGFQVKIDKTLQTLQKVPTKRWFHNGVTMIFRNSDGGNNQTF